MIKLIACSESTLGPLTHSRITPFSDDDGDDRRFAFLCCAPTVPEAPLAHAKNCPENTYDSDHCDAAAPCQPCPGNGSGATAGSLTCSTTSMSVRRATVGATTTRPARTLPGRTVANATAGMLVPEHRVATSMSARRATVGAPVKRHAQILSGRTTVSATVGTLVLEHRVAPSMS
eukprot:CAMPEP_0175807892 /NCGR_PEP_ID=MMETSP0107_2-20121207/1966_1 /TAXON_ID=195067 ORGANISM="Goniomonas pacifica, Strain CCMP1869" /NCGR_SAMPLE_ID=MMETSP0107_2 /ASSEMBLY_ACC=CAM_ASM_000203 /LENGTH=174 /DNA_ID=CAMNT_0017119479 /DNA_START=458 /DNA_END=986 /DNA_ORIENTATION=-